MAVAVSEVPCSVKFAAVKGFQGSQTVHVTVAKFSEVPGAHISNSDGNMRRGENENFGDNGQLAL